MQTDKKTRKGQHEKKTHEYSLAATRSRKKIFHKKY